jgi:formylglycine-generating enzyme required for sulfatase activity
MNFEVAPKTTEIQATWYNAQMYCLFLNVNGKTGWRLPTKEELDYIYYSKNDFVVSYYWSSTELNGTNAWSQYLSNGDQSFPNKRNSLYVRPVRDIK